MFAREIPHRAWNFLPWRQPFRHRRKQKRPNTSSCSSNFTTHARARHCFFVLLPLLPKIHLIFCFSAHSLRKQVEGKQKRESHHTNTQALRTPFCFHTSPAPVLRSRIAEASGSKKEDSLPQAYTDFQYIVSIEKSSPSTCFRRKTSLYQFDRSFCGSKTPQTQT